MSATRWYQNGLTNERVEVEVPSAQAEWYEHAGPPW